MLQLRPTCENCNKPLPPASPDARICSYECTYCSDCALLLRDVCPNCGGNFVTRPIRPAHEWKPGVFLGKQPATAEVTYKPTDYFAHATLVERVGHIPPENR